MNPAGRPSRASAGGGPASLPGDRTAARRFFILLRVPAFAAALSLRYSPLFAAR